MSSSDHGHILELLSIKATFESLFSPSSQYYFIVLWSSLLEERAPEGDGAAWGAIHLPRCSAGNGSLANFHPAVHSLHLPCVFWPHCPGMSKWLIRSGQPWLWLEDINIPQGLIWKEFIARYMALVALHTCRSAHTQQYSHHFLPVLKERQGPTLQSHCLLSCSTQTGPSLTVIILPLTEFLN